MAGNLHLMKATSTLAAAMPPWSRSRACPRLLRCSSMSMATTAATRAIHQISGRGSPRPASPRPTRPIQVSTDLRRGQQLRRQLSQVQHHRDWLHRHATSAPPPTTSARRSTACRLFRRRRPRRTSPSGDARHPDRGARRRVPPRRHGRRRRRLNPVTLNVTGLPTDATASFATNPVTPGAPAVTLTVTAASTTPREFHAQRRRNEWLADSFRCLCRKPASSRLHDSRQSGLTDDESRRNVTYTANVAPLNGFTGSVGLSVSGLPSGTSIHSCRRRFQAAPAMRRFRFQQRQGAPLGVSTRLSAAQADQSRTTRRLA